MLHCDYFRFEVVGRTRLSEEVDEEEMTGKVDESVLVVLISSEKVDEKDPQKSPRNLQKKSWI